MKRFLVSFSVIVAATLAFSTAAFAEDEEDPCTVLAEGLCELCGDTVCDALAQEEEPTPEECIELLTAIGELAEEVDELPEEDQEAVGVAFCEEIEKSLAEEE